ncbi:MAG: CPBP family intramembrane metalloprotease [Bacteroidetes bacterium]|nr:MAG: CPBP family intramembrane metalloprotease [Bacteroidota bacterium]
MKRSTVIVFLTVFLSLLTTTMTLFTPMPVHIKLIIRLILITLSITAWLFFKKQNKHVFSLLGFAFFVLNLAFLIVAPFTSEFLNLDMGSTKGIALSKLSDSLIISSVIIASVLLAKQTLRSIYITQGRLIPGLVTGFVFFILFGFLAFRNPDQPVDPSFLRNNWVWILIFVMANGFMEELIFRGLFLEKLNLLFSHHFSILITSVCFAMPHIIVQYQADTLLFAGICFVLGMICGYAMHYTRSIIAPALIHAGADLMIMVPIFATYGISG